MPQLDILTYSHLWSGVILVIILNIIYTSNIFSFIIQYSYIRKQLSSGVSNNLVVTPFDCVLSL